MGGVSLWSNIWMLRRLYRYTCIYFIKHMNASLQRHTYLPYQTYECVSTEYVWISLHGDMLIPQRQQIHMCLLYETHEWVVSHNTDEWAITHTWRSHDTDMQSWHSHVKHINDARHTLNRRNKTLHASYTTCLAHVWHMFTTCLAHVWNRFFWIKYWWCTSHTWMSRARHIFYPQRHRKYIIEIWHIQRRMTYVFNVLCITDTVLVYTKKHVSYVSEYLRSETYDICVTPYESET